MLEEVLFLALGISLYLFVRLPFSLPRRLSPCGLRPPKDSRTSGTRSAMVVLGSGTFSQATRILSLSQPPPLSSAGGHTAEMFPLLRALPEKGVPHSRRVFVRADTDHTSVARALAEGVMSHPSRVVSIPRAREVGQGWLSSAWTTFVSLVHSFALVAVEDVDLVLCNGPGTCVPIAASAFLLRWLGLGRAHVVFVESACRVETMSLTGRILLLFADRVLVQWPQLHARYPQTELVGLLLGGRT
jgi:beta-1,4-N-acetylglucosaminyltransferase